KFVTLLQFGETAQPVVTDSLCVVLQILVAQNIQHRKAGCTSYWIAAERAKEFHTSGEGRSDFLRRDNRSQRKCVADWFTENGDVRNDALRFKSPKMRAQPSKTDLNFVSNADASGRADVAICFRQIVLRENNLSGNAGQSFGEKCRAAILL